MSTETHSLRQVRRELRRAPHRVWLAGIGALVKAAAEDREQGRALFKELVEAGRRVEEQWGGSQGALLSLLRVREIFDLNQTEVGELFGTRRQAVASWQEHGVPTARQPKLHTLLEIGELLERKLKPGRVPGVFRKPAEAYGGKSMFDWVRAGRQDEVLDRVRETFDWAVTA